MAQQRVEGGNMAEGDDTSDAEASLEDEILEVGKDIKNFVIDFNRKYEFTLSEGEGKGFIGISFNENEPINYKVVIKENINYVIYPFLNEAYICVCSPPTENFYYTQKNKVCVIGSPNEECLMFSEVGDRYRMVVNPSRTILLRRAEHSSDENFAGQKVTIEVMPGQCRQLRLPLNVEYRIVGLQVPNIVTPGEVEIIVSGSTGQEVIKRHFPVKDVFTPEPWNTYLFALEALSEKRLIAAQPWSLPTSASRSVYIRYKVNVELSKAYELFVNEQESYLFKAYRSEMGNQYNVAFVHVTCVPNELKNIPYRFDPEEDRYLIIGPKKRYIVVRSDTEKASSKTKVEITPGQKSTLRVLKNIEYNITLKDYSRITFCYPAIVCLCNQLEVNQ